MTARHLILSVAMVMVLSACGGGGTDDTPSASESLAIETYVGSEFHPSANRYRLKYVKNGKVMWVDADGRTGDIIGMAR